MIFSCYQEQKYYFYGIQGRMKSHIASTNNDIQVYIAFNIEYEHDKIRVF